jgi:hypothetical protein
MNNEERIYIIIKDDVGDIVNFEAWRNEGTAEDRVNELNELAENSDVFYYVEDIILRGYTQGDFE